MIKITYLFPIIFLVACNSSDSIQSKYKNLLFDESNVYTLYRNSPIDITMRIHVASFDSSNGSTFNMSYCQTAQELFQKNEGSNFKFWCEKGKFKL